MENSLEKRNTMSLFKNLHLFTNQGAIDRGKPLKTRI
jgi:hypothetical protein